ncbi:hypothetical protein ACFV0O_35540 [Kitasatospora sp. NPDC059577]|uniref:hypothetical protein n=1 Tax=unclassified Kitasatospora TaxID=2633591 RepID=UPI00367C0B43
MSRCAAPGWPVLPHGRARLTVGVVAGGPAPSVIGGVAPAAFPAPALTAIAA